jgi:hypothetical protein
VSLADLANTLRAALDRLYTPRRGHFTGGGHFIVLRGVTADGKILVADPGSYSRSEKEWDLSIILNEASKRAGAGGPFWIIG